MDLLAQRGVAVRRQRHTERPGPQGEAAAVGDDVHGGADERALPPPLAPAREPVRHAPSRVSAARRGQPRATGAVRGAPLRPCKRGYTALVGWESVVGHQRRAAGTCAAGRRQQATDWDGRCTVRISRSARPGAGTTGATGSRRVSVSTTRPTPGGAARSSSRSRTAQGRCGQDGRCRGERDSFALARSPSRAAIPTPTALPEPATPNLRRSRAAARRCRGFSP